MAQYPVEYAQGPLPPLSFPSLHHLQSFIPLSPFSRLCQDERIQNKIKDKKELLVV